MKKEFITISGLKKVLSPKEMKNVLGGSGICSLPCIIYCNNGNKYCSDSPSGNICGNEGVDWSACD